MGDNQREGPAYERTIPNKRSKVKNIVMESDAQWAWLFLTV